MQNSKLNNLLTTRRTNLSSPTMMSSPTSLNSSRFNRIYYPTKLHCLQEIFLQELLE